jgi:hypothetical protein
MPAGKTDPDAVEFNKLKGQFLVIEEKVDGTGVSISLDSRFDLKINHRGSPATGKEFNQLYAWADQHWEDLLFLLGERYVLFGEWMYNKHTIFYDNLPNYFLESDIYDSEKKIWLSTMARNSFLKGHNYIRQVPVIAAGKLSASYQLTQLVGKSAYQTSSWKEKLLSKCAMLGTNPDIVMKETDQSGLMEGLYVKHEDDNQVVGRYKYVRYEFLQSILNSGTHLIDRYPIYNNLKEEPQL